MTGATQRRVARLAGIDQGGLSRIERGLEGRPSGRRLARILVVLDWLSGGGDPDGPWADLDTLRPERLGTELGPAPPPVVGARSLPPPSQLDDDDGPLDDDWTLEDEDRVPEARPAEDHTWPLEDLE